MKVSNDSVVSFHYTLSDTDGTELESSSGEQPTVYLHGHNGIIPGLETELADKEAGDSVNITLAPEQAYGLRREDRVQRVPVKHLVFKGKLRVGMAVQLNTSEGRHPVTVVKTGRHSADVDTNHPLAGKTLSFSVQIVDVRAASPEELSHGHAHGPGGHQH
jgi:FKBP-type peptidyl-prolyl cis-trans isomerase SlyD